MKNLKQNWGSTGCSPWGASLFGGKEGVTLPIVVETYVNDGKFEDFKRAVYGIFY